MNPRSLWLFTDGSKLQDHRTGAGWVLYCAGRRITPAYLPLGQFSEVYDAEAEALRQGLKAAISHPLAGSMDMLWACLDNKAVVTAVHSSPTGSSTSALHECQDLLRQWEARQGRFSTLPPGKAGVVWVPSHVGIAGNEEADSEAKAGAAQPVADHPQRMTAAGARRWVREATEQDFMAYREDLAPDKQLRQDCARLRPSPELALPRAALARLLAARSGHGDFAAYHDRFNHMDAERRCRCGAFKKPDHFLHCRVARFKELLRDEHGQQLTSTELLSTARGARLFAAWAAASDFFTTTP